MLTYEEALNKYKEIGFVEQVLHSVVYVTGLPGLKPMEVVIMETGETGQVISLAEDHAEVLLLSAASLGIGTKVVRTGELLQIRVGEHLLGKVVNPLAHGFDTPMSSTGEGQLRLTDVPPLGIDRRKDIDRPFETGVSLVDLVVPLGTGQRELVIGDRKIGKTYLLKQAVLSHAKRGGISVYAGIARRLSDVFDLKEFLTKNHLEKNLVVVTSTASDPAGLIYLTPYSAMTVAEYFRDMGIDVLVVLDDLSIHAKHYREISLLAQRFPGRSAYPGDIFFTHSRLLERAGNFTKGSITCLPVAETVLGDLSGYIQTNLMSMTDGHVYFDHELYNQGRRPAINHFLSVTRVGHQTQTPLLKSLSRNLSSFMVHHEKLKQLMHFGGELSGDVKKLLALGDRIVAFFNQATNVVVPNHVGAVFLASIWGGVWDTSDIEVMKQRFFTLSSSYLNDPRVKQAIDDIIEGLVDFTQLIDVVKKNAGLIVGDGRTMEGTNKGQAVEKHIAEAIDTK